MPSRTFIKLSLCFGLMCPICVPVSISTQPQSATITAGRSVTLSAGASGTSPLSYQWYQGPMGDTSKPLPNGTGASVTLSPSTTTSYWVRISNACDFRNSAGAIVTVEEEDICIPPSIEAQPRVATLDQGGFAALSVRASGTSLSYQWYEGMAFDTSSPVPGGTADTLLVSPASTANYWVRVANGCGLDDSSAAMVKPEGRFIRPEFPARSGCRRR